MSIFKENNYESLLDNVLGDLKSIFKQVPNKSNEYKEFVNDKHNIEIMLKFTSPKIIVKHQQRK